ncbi:MAG: DUF4293 family protein [Rhodothermaceae bacterium]|nr:DUF4293 family protein [Rhodothermaceae bacterium]
MIQRIQTIYLLLSAALLGVFISLGGSWLLFASAAFAWLPPVAYGLAGLTAAAALLSVFLYKQRDQQHRVITAAQWLDLVLVLVLGVTFGMLSYRTDTDLATVDIGALVVLLCPVVAYVFLRLAQRGVRKDIELVRSMDRLR